MMTAVVNNLNYCNNYVCEKNVVRLDAKNFCEIECEELNDVLSNIIESPVSFMLHNDIKKIGVSYSLYILEQLREAGSFIDPCVTEDPFLEELTKYMDFFSQDGCQAEKIFSLSSENYESVKLSSSTQVSLMFYEMDNVKPALLPQAPSKDSLMVEDVIKKEELTLQQKVGVISSEKWVFSELQNRIENIVKYNKKEWEEIIGYYRNVWISLANHKVTEWAGIINFSEIKWMEFGRSDEIGDYKNILSNILDENIGNGLMETLFLLKILFSSSGYIKFIEKNKIYISPKKYIYEDELKNNIVSVHRVLMKNNETYKNKPVEESIKCLAWAVDLSKSSIINWVTAANFSSSPLHPGQRKSSRIASKMTYHKRHNSDVHFSDQESKKRKVTPPTLKKDDIPDSLFHLTTDSPVFLKTSIA